eukprot:7381489-Prymnesium_polylepis.1
MSRADYMDLDAADYTLVAFGRSAAAEGTARSHMASVIAQCGASSSSAARLPKPLPPLQGAADAAPATPLAPPPRSYMAMRVAVD